MTLLEWCWNPKNFWSTALWALKCSIPKTTWNVSMTPIKFAYPIFSRCPVVWACWYWLSFSGPLYHTLLLKLSETLFIVCKGSNILKSLYDLIITRWFPSPSSSCDPWKLLVGLGFWSLGSLKVEAGSTWKVSIQNGFNFSVSLGPLQSYGKKYEPFGIIS